MKKLYFFLYFALVALALPMTSCEDEELNPIPDYETAVSGQGFIAADSPKNFKEGDLTTPMKFDVLWRSIDRLNTVNKIQLYVTWTESYIDVEGNPRTANHGTRLAKTLEGSAVPANNTKTSVTLTANEVATLFANAQFDYGDGKGRVSVFTAPKKPSRTAAVKFITDDKFVMTWVLTTADGRVFDSWSDTVCLEFVGVNCEIPWGVTK